ncbi:MAG: hypothetical protein K5683_12495, partial [Prevotella sp.]|nr:hypothetical protein [Prevotella sp.]
MQALKKNCTFALSIGGLIFCGHTMAKIFASARADFTQSGSREKSESDERLEDLEKHREHKLFNKKFLTTMAIKVKAVERLIKFN